MLRESERKINSQNHAYDDWDNVHSQLLQVQKKSLNISEPGDTQEKEADDIARKVVNEDGQATRIPKNSFNGSSNSSKPQIQRKIDVDGHQYEPAEITDSLTGFTKTAVDALNQMNKGTTGSDGPLFIKNLTDAASSNYTVKLSKSSEYNPDANMFTPEKDDTGKVIGGTLLWNPDMGLIYDTPFTETKEGVETKNFKTSPIRILLHELDHADRMLYLAPMINNLHDPEIKDKMTGLNDQQKTYLQNGIDRFTANGWSGEEMYMELKISLWNKYNSIKAEEERVMTGSEKRSGEVMKEGTRSNYMTGVKGVYKAKGVMTTEEGTPTEQEKILIDEENKRIKGG